MPRTDSLEVPGRIVPADGEGIAEAAAAIAAGRLVAFPTETVYGLGADATNGAAVAAVFAAKARPRFNPLIVHLPSPEAARQHGAFDAAATALAEAFWPGPLTLVVPRLATSPVHDLATAGLDSIALRVPAHPVAMAMLAAAGRPVVAPSANRSGRVSPTRAEHVAADLSDSVALVLDAGPTVHGLESTVVACLGGEVRLLRPGALPREAIEHVLGRPLAVGAAAADPKRPLAPGNLVSHYAPAAAVRLAATSAGPGEAFLGFGPEPAAAAGASARLNLSPAGDLAEAARNLFAHLRALDATGVATIAVAPIPDRGLGEAINDRLQRAAAPRG